MDPNLFYYSILFVFATIFAYLFLKATKAPYHIQSNAMWNRMLSERNNQIEKVNGVDLKPGDVLALLPMKSDGSDGYFFSIPHYLKYAADGLIEELKISLSDDNKFLKLLESFFSFDNIKFLTALITKGNNLRYLHIEIYLGGGWCIAGTGAGVNIRKIPTNVLSLFDVYRFNQPVDTENLIKVSKKHWNKRYDTFSMSFNGFLAAFGFKPKKDTAFYNDDSRIMCSEFAARLFNDLSTEKIFEMPEHTLPDSFALAQNHFDVIFYDINVTPHFNEVKENFINQSPR